MLLGKKNPEFVHSFSGRIVGLKEPLRHFLTFRRATCIGTTNKFLINSVLKELELRPNQKIILPDPIFGQKSNLGWLCNSLLQKWGHTTVFVSWKEAKTQEQWPPQRGWMQKRNKKTIGKNVGHKDADNKVWGDREAALQNAGKVRWQVDKMAFDVDSSACVKFFESETFFGSNFYLFLTLSHILII